MSSGVQGFLPEQREWIIRNLTEKNEWLIFLDDNIKMFNALQNDHYKKNELDPYFVANNNKLFRNLFEQEISGERFMEICEEMIDIGEAKQAYLCGFATNDNPFFRCKKFKLYSYVIGKAMIRKTTRISFPIGWFCQEDYHDTAEHILQYGSVLVNNFVKPVATHYNIGGIGTYAKRVPYKLDLNKKLMQKYPGLFRVNEKVNCPSGAEIIIKLHSEKQIENWRKQMRLENGQH
jgi:hypothetical protein